MTDTAIYKKLYSEDIPVNDREIWRYAGYAGIPGEDKEDLGGLLEEVKTELQGIFQMKVCYRKFEIKREGDGLVLPFSFSSDKLEICLKGCGEAIALAATIGPEIDRRANIAKLKSPTKALLMQAYGAERIEALCDLFCKDMREEAAKQNLEITPRFSPGYGDWDLEVQKEFFSFLDIYHQIGISLGETLMMTPSKSVTAVFGIRPQSAEQTECTDKSKCESCELKECQFREE